MRLPFLLTVPRVLRHSAAIGADLPPDEAVSVDAPDPALRAALASAADGDHGPARELLAGTREHTQWELRDGYVSRLAEAALHNPGWLDAWQAEHPEDPDAALTRADLRIHQAWELRTAEGAGQVPPDRFRAFFALLEDAVPVVGRAAGLNPADPVPWRIALTHALGSQAPREVFDGYWSQALARDPHHYGCHTAALKYLSAKWHGSHAEMFDFAERAADTAPPGSKLHALPLFAALEYVVLSPGPDAPYTSRVAAALTRALDLSAAYGPGSQEAAGFRNCLALMLLRAERWEEALDAFRGIGTHATRFPWAYFGDDPRQEFLETRSGTRIQLASLTPFFGRPPQPRTAPAPALVRAPGAPCAVAIAAARPADVAQAALMCGVSLRTAPATDTHTYIEAVAEARPAKRSVLSTEDPLTTAADNFTTGEKWPTLVLRRTPERCGLTLFLKGRPLAAHEWNATSPAPDHSAVTATAEALARAFALADPRPLTHILRSTGNPPRHQSDLLAALALPPLPPGFGDRPDVLDTLPGARVLTRRGLLAGMRSAMTTQDGEHPAPPDAYRPRRPRWWLLRVLGLLLFSAAAVHGWAAPDITPALATAYTLAALSLAAGLTRAWRRRRAHAATATAARK
ncbi:hypothetical protein OG978_24445 [Streptomyces sp. NBC_01591]|uniref:hypothetical protein n=1 Tax=Streptomyces sp. NBC_01591 TaxID=2975888 RepID=UPI002DDA90E3|nr:hypothetical protein [Streptomyces sp. NBC_01591]WSD70244.1 hypothetical protein OG978_24445 [Streptomyces sp. NBC_01591]